MKSFFKIMLFSSAALMLGCRKDRAIERSVPSVNTFKTTPYQFGIPTGFPQPLIPEDNPMTQEGVRLGRLLFYDKVLSADSSMACATCHKQENGFASSDRFSKGITGSPGDRNAMTIINLAWEKGGFFWDGRAAEVEDQVKMPVENPVEMHESWPNVVMKLSRSKFYPDSFQAAFGTPEITEQRAAKALAQFIRSIVSADSKFDRYFFRGQQQLFNDQEKLGLQLFTSSPQYDPLTHQVTYAGADCFHCHSAPFFQDVSLDGSFRNNGLDSVSDVSQFKDFGRGKITGNPADYGKFKVPTLRNIELTGPYMHDGRFKTLDQVVNHYDAGGKPSPTLDPNMPYFHKFSDHHLQLTQDEKAAVVAFLKTLTDTGFIHNKAYANPFR